ncbi:redoxin domain-containing protein [Streptomyces violaceusniger]|uniref:TlpA disulfide reductase family protein n=2 Tax=Streptomyces violaceusniger group TaxID=2839105 RepID=A0ABD5J6A7_9ACTN|nr:TlpA disulfide reductase family protein [Streptomyces violaceusniger]KUL57724.1 redoxin domain-containing protein [Streptomyces violaceusniger]MEE4583801.1 TlpA disulfide reductase family protein [Streptomyces sp. DSM 41602]
MSACRAPRGLANRRRATVLAVGATVAALSLTACGGGGTSGGSADTKFVQGKGGVDTVSQENRKDAPQLSGKTLEGKPLDVADYKGKVVVLNVWGSWCTPCRAEAPNLVKVAKDTKAKGVQFIGINTRDSNRAPALSFEKEYGVGYPSLYDPMGKLMLRFPKGSLNPQTIPSTIVLDREGRIAARALTPLSEERLRSMITPLIAEK